MLSNAQIPTTMNIETLYMTKQKQQQYTYYTNKSIRLL